MTIPSLEGDVISFNLPDGDWTVSSAGRAGNLTTGLKYWRIDGGAIPSFDVTSIDVGAEQAIDLQPDGEPKLSRSDNRVVDGVEGYVVEGSDRSGYAYTFGAVYGESLVYISFDFDNDSAKAKGWVESVLASAEWL